MLISKTRKKERIAKTNQIINATDMILNNLTIKYKLQITTGSYLSKIAIATIALVVLTFVSIDLYYLVAFIKNSSNSKVSTSVKNSNNHKPNAIKKEKVDSKKIQNTESVKQTPMIQNKQFEIIFGLNIFTISL